MSRMYLVIETNSGSGKVRDVQRHDTEKDAIEAVVETAKNDGYIQKNEYPTEKDLRKQLASDKSYEDGDVLTTIYAL